MEGVKGTEKQIKFASSLGIKNPYSFNKADLTKAIDEKLKEKNQVSGNVNITQTGQHDVILNRIEKPHSFEFGKAGHRHKIYYADIEELKNHIKELIEAGLYNDEIESYESN